MFFKLIRTSNVVRDAIDGIVKLIREADVPAEAFLVGKPG